MNLSISYDKENHVLIVDFLELLGLSDGLFKKLGEICWTAQTYEFQNIAVLLLDLFNTVKVWIVDTAIDWEAMMDLVLGI
jgi:hypothetical protein